MAERIGIFGGSFNPIHVGHLVIAEAAWQEFSLRKVLFIPSGDAPNKDMHHIDKNIRYAMVEKAIEGNGHFMISPIERDRQGPSYTVDTIRILQREFGDEYEFYFICGTDAVADLPTWKYNRELLSACHFPHLISCVYSSHTVQSAVHSVNNSTIHSYYQQTTAYTALFTGLYPS